MKSHTEKKIVEAPLCPTGGNPPQPKWRQALVALMAPAMRVHRYRNLRSAIFYDAMCHHDCGKPS